MSELDKYFGHAGSKINSEWLDSMTDLLPVVRKFYGSDCENKPSEECFWCALRGSWFETDKSLRERLTRT